MVLFEPNLRPNAREIVELLGIKLRELFRLPATDEEFDRRRCNFRSVIPTGKGQNEHGLAEVWLLCERYVRHGFIVLPAREGPQ